MRFPIVFLHLGDIQSHDVIIEYILTIYHVESRAISFVAGVDLNDGMRER